MTCVVIVVEASIRTVVEGLLPACPAVGTGVDRCYFLYQVAGEVEDLVFNDPITGLSLTEMYSFPTMDAAKAWVEAHNQQRQALRAAEGRAQ